MSLEKLELTNDLVIGAEEEIFEMNNGCITILLEATFI